MVNALTSWQFEAGTVDLHVHQALHGYAEGHRLLESSIPIPDDLKRLMLRMSDLSGTSVMAGFQEYLTGYPLPSLNAYALAKTWYAPEMPRPGCVWTHTFIIPAHVMTRIPALSAFRPLFRRPSERSITDSYSRPILFDLGQTVLDRQPDLNQLTLMQSLLAAHYHKNWRPLILSANDSNEFADLILAAWSQKWPALRMNFTFCTGSLSARSVDKRPLDVQCAPISATRQVSREVASEGFGEPILVNPSPCDQPRWTALAANDALQYEGGPLRNFLWSVSDVDSTLSDFESFVSIYDGLWESAPFPTVLDQTAEFFPHVTDGQQLKAALFGDRTKWGLPPVQSQDLLLALATTERYASFDADGLSLRDRASRLMTGEPLSGCKLVGDLLQASLNPLGEEILTTLIVAMDVESALTIATTQPQFLPTLFRGNARLACSAQLWSIAGDHKRELFESLLAQQLTQPELERGIVNALLDSDSEAFLRRAFAHWGAPAVFQALEWTETHHGMMNETCRAALTFHVQDVMAWVHDGQEKSTLTLTAVAHVVAPYTSQITQNDSTVWLHTFHSLRNAQRHDEAEYVCAFLLALALCNAPPAPLDLVAESFERIHLIAERNQMRDSVWCILQPLVPELSWGKNWDKCERMRRALVAAFVHHSWPSWELRRRIKDEQVVRQLLKSAKKVDVEYYFQDA